jgi:PAS domain S-box-containing protein
VSDEARPQILLVDDDGTVREHLAQSLSDEFRIETAADGIHALRQLLRVRPDVIATDIVMPDLDGIGFLKTLRGTPSMRLIPVLLISGHAPEELRIRGFEEGADGYLSKPYSERELRARLRSMVQIARERAEASRREALDVAERQAVAERAALLESITDPFYALDKCFRFTYVNQRAADYFQLPRADLLQRSLWELFPQVRGSRFEIEYRRALQFSRPGVFEALSPVTERWVDVHVYPSRSGLAINFRDITERKEVERALRQSEEARTSGEIKQKAAAIRDAIRVRLADTLRPLRNPDEIELSATRILGEHLGALRVMYMVISQDGLYATVRANYISSGEGVLGRHRLDDFGANAMSEVRAGKTLVIDDVANDLRLEPHAKANTLGLGIAAHVLAPVFEGHQLVAALAVQQSSPTLWSPEEIAFIQEFSERTFLALERLRSDAEIREANRRKDEFLATLAHELRNPLAPMRSAVHLLNKLDGNEKQARHARDIIERQIHHMVRLVDDLMDVTRINIGQVNLRNEIVSISTVMTDAMEAARSSIEEGRHVLDVETPTSPGLVEGDATRLVQIFQNLLTNAAKYTPTGGHIQFRAEIRTSEVRVTVRDNGLGIAPEAQERIFELFTRVHPSDSIKASGLGIGLALARRLAELHNGRIEVTSAGVDRGSEFAVYLPLLKTSEVRAAPPTPETETPKSQLRILIVDDNRDAAESLAMLLQIEGHATTVAFDGRQALQEFSRSEMDIVVLDIGMPIMDGYEVARRIRSTTSGSKVVLLALTGWGQAEDKQRSLDAGFDLHIAKPVDPTTLASLLAAAVRRRSTDQAV